MYRSLTGKYQFSTWREKFYTGFSQECGKWLKEKLIKEGSQLASSTNQLEILAKDGKVREIDVIDIEQALRLIQLIPSKKTELFRMWLAKVGTNILVKLWIRSLLLTERFRIIEDLVMTEQKATSEKSTKKQ